MKNTNYIVVFVTTKDQAQAATIAQALLAQQLIACANILPKVDSFFSWQGKVDHAQEAMLVLKSRQDLFPQIAEQVKKLHTYDVPEIIALPIIDGNADYLNWISESTQK